MLDFTLNIVSKIDPIAVYAAIVATFVLVWDIVKWSRTGVRLTGKATGGWVYVDVPGYDPNTKYISVEVHNIGTQPTTITNVAFQDFRSRWHRILGQQPLSRGVVQQDKRIMSGVPYVLEPGQMFRAQVKQDDELVTASNEHAFYIVLPHGLGKTLWLRVPPISN